MDSIKVFIVDDEKNVVDWLRNQSDWAVYNCEVVGFSMDATEALSFMEDNRVDLLVTDISMPGMSGLDLIRLTKQRYPDQLILVISAFDTFSYVKEAFKYGIIDYCLKPIDVNELVECIKVVRNVYEEKKIGLLGEERLLFLSSLLQRIIGGGLNEAQIDEQCEIARIDLKMSVWQVVVLKRLEQNGKENKWLIHPFQTWEEEGAFCFLDEYMNMVCLFYSKEKKNMEQKIHEVLKMEDQACTFTACIGEPLKSYRHIRKSYQKCLAFLRGSVLLQERILWTKDYNYEKYGSLIQSGEIEQLLLCIRKEDFSNIVDIMQKMLRKYKNEKDKKAEIICLYVYMINYILDKDPYRKINVMENYLDVRSSVEEMMRWVECLCKKIFEIDTDIVLQPHVKFVLKEIDTRFWDTDLSLQKLAERRQISPAYLGKVFKEQIGEYFSDYLLRTRLTRSQELLGKKGWSIGDVAEAVGFSNQSYFNKMFRRFYQMSPAEYRREMSKERETNEV